MKELLAKHFEKLICIVALLGVCLGCLIAMNLHLPENDKLQKIEPLGTDRLKPIEAKEQQDNLVKLKESADTYDGSIFYYCRSCGSLLAGSQERCKKCGTTVLLQVVDPVGEDSDGDSIPNKIEIRENLDPNNAADAALDRDGDGFSNRDELITFDGKPGCIDDAAEHPPYIALYGAVKAPVINLPFTLVKIDVDPSQNPKTWGLKFQVKKMQRKQLLTRNVNKTVAEAEALDDEVENLKYTPTAIEVDAQDPENPAKMKVTLTGADGKKVIAQLGQPVAPADAFRVDFSSGDKKFSVTQLGGKFSLNGANKEVQHFVLRQWDAKNSVAKVYCEEDKTESDVGAAPAVKCPVKK